MNIIEAVCHCGCKFAVPSYHSIFAVLDSHLIKELLDGTLTKTSCPNCGNEFEIVTQILIQGPKGMAFISTDDPPEVILATLTALGVLNSCGEVRDTIDQLLDIRTGCAA
ncbi:MAG: CpXC domain-containing protein [Promethearchaeota archaeon]